MLLRKKLASITQRLKPPIICTLCNQYHKATTALCPTCLSHIKPIGIACAICANPLLDGLPGLCGLCIQKKPWFDKVFVPCSFEDPLRSLLHQFKYHQHLHLTKLFVHFMLQAFPKEIKPDYLVPMPLHPKRLTTRGYNQAALLAKMLAKKTNIPCQFNLCEKIINTPPQVELPRKERLKNLRKAFIVHPLQAKHIVIVDDLLTTGSTANALARQFKQQGIETVSVWCCARTSLFA